MTTRYTAAQVIEALKAHRGVYLTAKHLRVSPSTVYGYMRRWPTVKAAWQALDGEVTDVAEAALYRAIIAGEPWAVKFQLATKGKDRGYTERHEVTGKDGEPIESHVNIKREIDSLTDEERAVLAGLARQAEGADTGG